MLQNFENKSMKIKKTDLGVSRNLLAFLESSAESSVVRVHDVFAVLSARALKKIVVLL